MESRTRRPLRVITVCLTLVLMLLRMEAAHAQPFSVPEHTETRIRLHELISGPLSTVLVSDSEIHRQRFTPHRVQFSHEVQGDFHYLIFTNEVRGAFVLPTRGSWVIRRQRESGVTDEIKVFLADDGRFFARLAPDGDGRPVTRVEVTLADDVIYRDVVVPVPFDRILVSPFSDIQRATEAIIDWNLFSVPPDRAANQMVERLVGRIRAHVSSAAASEGRETEASIVDLLMADIGFADTEDPDSLHSAGRSPGVVVGLVRFTTVVPDVGLPIEDLRRSLYLLAREHPGSFYIGSINTALRSNGQRDQGGSSTPHHHRVLVFPSFDPRGRFQTVVIDGDAETTVRSLSTRFEGHSIHLVRIRAHEDMLGTGDFQQPLLNQVLLNNE